MKQCPFIVRTMCLLALILFGCHKREGMYSRSTYTFLNLTGEPITFDVYASKEDYDRNVNRIHQYFIWPDGDQKIEFDAPKKYWIDWYNENYSINNWRNGDNTLDGMHPAPEILVAAEDDTYIISGGMRDTARSVLLNGSGTGSAWQGNALNAGIFTGTHRFTFRKDYTGEYAFTDSVGRTTVTPVIFTIRIYQRDYANSRAGEFTLSVSSELDRRMFCEVLCAPFLPSYPGRDTLRATFSYPQPGYRLNIIRQ